MKNKRQVKDARRLLASQLKLEAGVDALVPTMLYLDALLWVLGACDTDLAQTLATLQCSQGELSIGVNES